LHSPVYRWNLDEAARAYDAAAEHIHPHYVKLQNEILRLLSQQNDRRLLVVDAGGGSGLLMERILEQLPQAEGMLVDQSKPYLTLSAERLSRFGARVKLVQLRLQDDWSDALPRPAEAIVSMSAIHHLAPEEKCDLCSRCHDCLAPDGVFLNGDEVRAESDEAYLAALMLWAQHMDEGLATGEIPACFGPMVSSWKHRNIEEFGAAKQSGDDCHETIATQIDYLRSAGFADAHVAWQQGMWALFAAVR
jgi:tRNA (cmo5U34)-methyltransferase